MILVPILSVTLSLFLSRAIARTPTHTPFYIFLAAVMISGWYGGWPAGFIATLLASAITAWELPPIRSFTIGDPGDLIRWAIFMAVALMISFLHMSRANSETKLHWSEQRLSLAVDTARLGVWDYNLLTRTFWWSKTLEQTYGRTDGSFPSTYGQFFACIHFDDQPMFNRAITRTIDEGTDYEIDHRIVLPDNSVRWVNTRGRLFFNENARAERIVGIVTDITAQKQMDDQHRQVLELVEKQKRLSPVA